MEKIPVRHLWWRTDQTYRGWAWRLAEFLGARPVETVTGVDVRSFLSHLATAQRAGASAQKQALNGVVFLLREVERKGLGDFGEFTRVRRRLRMPVVLSREECARLFEAIGGGAQTHGRAGLQERLRRLYGQDREVGLPGVWLPEGNVSKVQCPQSRRNPAFQPPPPTPVAFLRGPGRQRGEFKLRSLLGASPDTPGMLPVVPLSPGQREYGEYPGRLRGGDGEGNEEG